MSSHSGGGGGLAEFDLSGVVTPQIDPGTDLEDEQSIPASPPAADEHGVVPCRRMWIVNWNRYLGTLVPFRRW